MKKYKALSVLFLLLLIWHVTNKINMQLQKKKTKNETMGKNEVGERENWLKYQNQIPCIH